MHTIDKDEKNHHDEVDPKIDQRTHNRGNGNRDLGEMNLSKQITMTHN